MAFGWKKMGDAINPSAVGVQNKHPQVYGLAKLSALDPVTCTEQLRSTFDWYTVAFGAGGAAIGAVTDRWDFAASGVVIAALARNYFTRETECQSVWNALFDVLAGLAGYQLALLVQGKK